MTRLSESAECCCIARWPRRSRLPAAMLAALLLAPLGCQTVHYTAANIPQQLRVRPTQRSSAFNLERLAGQGVGTLQIGPGDLLDVTIASGQSDERPEPAQARVSRDGTLLVPVVGPVSVTGLEPPEAEQRIASAAIERGLYRQPYVTLTVIEQAVNRVTVLGAVKQPGVQALPRGASDLLSALAAAGGLAEDAGTQVEILHRNSPSLLTGQAHEIDGPAPGKVAMASYEDSTGQSAPPLGLASPTPAEEGSTPNAPLPAPPPFGPQAIRIDLAQVERAGQVNCDLGDHDVVMVLPREKRIVHVAGLVTNPDQFEIPVNQDIRVLDAIAMAGGTKSPVADKVFVIRQLEDMAQPAIIKVSIAKAKHNGDENLLLAAGDLVSVETTAATAIWDTANTFIRVGIGWSGNLATF